MKVDIKAENVYFKCLYIDNLFIDDDLKGLLGLTVRGSACTGLKGFCWLHLGLMSSECKRCWFVP